MGQGSWATIVEARNCWHFDMGGQTPPNNQKLFKYCRGKSNKLAISHADTDHIRYIKRYAKSLKLCLFTNEKLYSRRIPNLENCESVKSPLRRLFKSSFSKKNEGDVYSWEQRIIFTGDLYKKQELLISPKSLESIEFLIVGHHGSKTSSHPKFVSRMPLLKQALVSARKRVYGHPHTTTKKTFKHYRVPLIQTEHFGSLIYELH